MHSTALHVASKETHCTALHGPGEAMMHRFTRNTSKWIPNFLDSHGTAWQAPAHMDRTWHRLWSSIHCDAAHGEHRAPMHGFAWTPRCTDSHRPAQIGRCTDLHGKRATVSLNAELHGFHAASLSFSRGCTSLHGSFLMYTLATPRMRSTCKRDAQQIPQSTDWAGEDRKGS